MNNPIADDRGIGVSKTAIGMVKGAMLLRVYHQTEATWRGERLAGSSRGPTHHGKSLVRSENGFLKLLWARHRIENLGDRASGIRRAGGQAPAKEASSGTVWQRLNIRTQVWTRRGGHYLGVFPGQHFPHEWKPPSKAVLVLLRPALSTLR